MSAAATIACPGVPTLGGPQTRPFILHPVELATSTEPIVGAAHVREVLSGWRRALQGQAAAAVTMEAVSADTARTS
jgi:hypothetical protein